MTDSAVLFLFFAAGVVCAAKGKAFFLTIFHALEARFSFPAELLLAALVFFLGSTLFGRFLIPPLAFFFGAAASIRCGVLLVKNGKALPAFLFPVLIPAFFLIGVLGMKNSSQMTRCLRLLGRREAQNAFAAFLIRTALLAFTALTISLFNSFDR